MHHTFAIKHIVYESLQATELPITSAKIKLYKLILHPDVSIIHNLVSLTSVYNFENAHFSQ